MRAHRRGTRAGWPRRRLGVVWIDAHGDLNTIETSPSGNQWGMPLRMLLDDGVVAPANVALVGARNLDPPEQDYVKENGIDDSLERALTGVDAVYAALDLDSLDPPLVDVLVPEPNGPSVEQIAAILQETSARAQLAGMGVTGHFRTEKNADVVTRLLVSAGL